MARLVPMTEDIFQAYLKRTIVEYAQDHVDAGNWDAAEALQKSEKEFQQLLPQGLASPKQHLYSIVDDETGVMVGMIWFAEQKRAGRPAAFIYDFLVQEEFRRRGYGKQALAALDEKVKEFGLESISLHVFGFNSGAIALYKLAGYEVTDLMMTRKLSG